MRWGGGGLKGGFGGRGARGGDCVGGMVMLFISNKNDDNERPSLIRIPSTE